MSIEVEGYLRLRFGRDAWCAVCDFYRTIDYRDADICRMGFCTKHYKAVAPFHVCRFYLENKKEGWT